MGVRKLIASWPVTRQLAGEDRLGLGSAVKSAATEASRARTETADKVVGSVCPYCAVGCGQLASVRGGKLVNLEGNPDSPISRGTLCPKGSAAFQLTVNPERRTKALHRKPGATDWEEIDLDRAMELIAQRVKKTRDETFRRTATIDGTEVVVNNTLGIASLGGATLDNEWNYAQAKLWRGLGGVFIENQARI